MSTSFESQIDAEMDAPPVDVAQPIESAIDHEISLEEHNTLPQQALTAVEGAAKGLLGPLATGAERALHEAGVPGISPQDQALRQEASPYIQGGSEAVSFLGGALAGVGLPSVLSKAGALGAEAVGAAIPAIGASRIGSKVVQGFIENGLFQGGNEVSKLINQDPTQSVGSALVNTGLMGAIGGSLSGGPLAVSALWKKTAGVRTGGILKAVSDKLGGIEGQYTDAVSQAIEKSGMEIDPVIKGALSSDREISEMFNALNQTDTSKAGLRTQKTFQTFLDDAGEVMSNGLGKDPNAIPAKLDRYAEGNLLGKTLSEESKQKIDPLVEMYESLKEQSSKLPLLEDEIQKIPVPGTINNPYVSPEFTEQLIPGTVSMMEDSLLKLSQNERWAASPSSDISKELKRVLGDLKNLKEVGDISALIKSVNEKIGARPPGDNTFKYQAHKIVQNLVEAEGHAIEQHINTQLKPGAQMKLKFPGPENISTQFSKARQGYAQAATLLEPFLDRLKLKGSIHGFPKRLKQMAIDDAESILKRLSGKNDAAILDYLSANFPRSAEVLRQSYVNDILSDAKVGDRINPYRVVKSFKDLSPQLKDFVARGSSQKIDAIGTILQHFKEMPHNYSNTARTILKHTQHNAGTAIGVASALMGHGVPESAIAGYLINAVSREGPDAAKLMLLQWLGSAKQVNAGAFKAGMDFINQTIKGENAIKGATKAVFDTASKVVPEHLIPKQEELETLDKRLKEIRVNPSALEKMGDLTGYYMPNHGVAIAATVAQAAMYVNANRPSVIKQAPLDPEIEPSEGQKQEFNQILKIAQQPLVVLEYLKRGTLTTEDLQHLTSMYPNVYQNMKTKLTSEMLDYLTEGKTVPYQSAFGLSLFFGQPMDSSFSAESVLSNQSVFMQAEQNEQSKARPAPSRMGKSKAASRLSLTPSDSGN